MQYSLRKMIPDVVVPYHAITVQKNQIGPRGRCNASITSSSGLESIAFVLYELDIDVHVAGKLFGYLPSLVRRAVVGNNDFKPSFAALARERVQHFLQIVRSLKSCNDNGNTV